MRLLVVEDDAKLVRALARGLRGEGYDIDVAYDGDKALELATADGYGAIVLDVMLPGADGFTVCEELRRRGRWTPVLMLTARSEVGDRIRGLDAGADDYLVKPFDFGELLARLRALIRRGPFDRGDVLTVRDLRIEPASRLVTRAGEPVDLTAREYEVLELLVRNAGRPVARSELLERVWSDHLDASSNVVDVYVGYLRRKIERPSDPRLIRTIRGVGFMVQDG
jgi:two-component system OmpR family response regulator